MIYGYELRTVNEFGLKQMREISIATSPDTLREFAAFLLEAAKELESASDSSHWHKHASQLLQRHLGCDVVVLHNES